MVTESGFGADLGMEKFMDIKCRASGLVPNCVVIVATVRALKMHGGVGNVRPGKPLPPELVTENLPALEKGCANLAKHIENRALLRRRRSWSRSTASPRTRDAEIELIKQDGRRRPARKAPISPMVWAKGGEGGQELAEAVVGGLREAVATSSSSIPTTCRSKRRSRRSPRRSTARTAWTYDKVAEQKIETYTKWGLGNLPICMAKTHLSLSHDSNLKGRPTGFRVPIRDIRPERGRGLPVSAARDVHHDAGAAEQSGGVPCGH